MALRPCFAALIAAGCIACVSGGSAAWSAEAPVAASSKWEPWAEIGGYASNRAYAQRGETALWAPLMQDGRSLLFADIRGKLFQDDEHEGNAALGYRFMGANGWNPGIWFGLDRRYTQFGNDFDQISFGGELLSTDWDLRLNGYVPLEDTKSVSGAAGATVVVSGGNIFLVSGGLEEVALWGFDAEVGYRVPLERYGLDGRTAGSAASGERYNDLRLFAGGFYFDNADFDGEVVGPRVRAEWRIENVIDGWEGSRLTFDAAYQYDDVRKEQLEAGLRLRIPLGGETGAMHLALSPQERRMTEGLKRDTDVVTQAQSRPGGGTQEPVEDADTGVDFDNVVIVANGGDLQAAIAGAGSNALVIAQGGALDFCGCGLFMNNDQTLLGGGGAIEVRGRTSGTVASYTAPGTRPVILGPGFAGIFAQNNAHIASVTLDGQNGGVFGVDAAGSTLIENVDIRGYDFGIVYFNGPNQTVRNTTISDTDVAAIYLVGGMNLDLRNSTIRDGGIGIYLSGGGGASTIAVNDTTFEGTFNGHLFEFEFDTHTVNASAGIVDNAASAGRCALSNGGNFNGTLGFTAGDVVAADCN
jgi:hypothetical protein